MIFADASALIAIIAGEAEADRLADLLEAERVRLCSALSVWETIAGLCRSYTFSVPAARTHVRRFLETGNFQLVGIGEREFDLAVRCLCRVRQRPSPGSAEHG
jgi:ribonuclease VapC